VKERVLANLLSVKGMTVFGFPAYVVYIVFSQYRKEYENQRNSSLHVKSISSLVILCLNVEGISKAF